MKQPILSAAWTLFDSARDGHLLEVITRPAYMRAWNALNDAVYAADPHGLHRPGAMPVVDPGEEHKREFVAGKAMKMWLHGAFVVQRELDYNRPSMTPGAYEGAKAEHIATWGIWDGKIV